MEEFIPQLKTDKEFTNKIIRKYHFGEENTGKVASLCDISLPLVSSACYYVWKKADTEITYDEYAVCLVTLGTAFDKLVDLYAENNCLLEAYMLDCIGLEFMTRSYEQLVKHIQTKYCKWGTKLDFLGDTYPVDMMARLMENFTGTGVLINDEMMLKPLKSVLFLLPVSDQEQKADACRICTNCGNVNCMFREASSSNRQHDISKLSGISRISSLPKNNGMPGGSYGIRQIFKNESVK